MFGRLERRSGGSRDIEVFFVEPAGSASGSATWRVLCRPGRRIRAGDRVVFPNADAIGKFQEADQTDLFVLEVTAPCPVEQLLERHGHVPLPPYIDRAEATRDRENYQTMFAEHAGAVAAPTAGLHFTPSSLEAIRTRGVEIIPITLHVGIGTFLPVRTEDPNHHVLRPERFEVSAHASERLQAAVQEGRRVIAVGTTTTRTLEFLMHEYGEIRAGTGMTDLYILPSFDFRIVGALLTNFHLPRSTLLMLVSAFAGRETVLAAYRSAVEERYRFYSYGDCMFVTR
jgi:S-adenosylmethionine:tRNA ribosyltransferase-isomerase